MHRIRRFTKNNVNKVNSVYCIVLILLASCSFRFFDWNEEEHVLTRNKNRFTALEEQDDMDSLNKNMTEIIPTKGYEDSKTNQETDKAENSIPYKSSDEEA